MKKLNKILLTIFSTLIILSVVQFASFAIENKKLCLGKGSTYMLFFDDSILKVSLINEKALKVDVITTLFNDRQQVLLTLLEDIDSGFTVVTDKNTYNYEVCTNCDKDMINYAQVDSSLQKQLGEFFLDMPPVSSMEVSGVLLDLPPFVMR